MSVKAKKHLGQHFLNDDNICRKIADGLTGFGDYKNVLEVGPGVGALTKKLLEKDFNTEVIEIDTESIEYLNHHYPNLVVHNKDFLKAPLNEMFDGNLAVIGNFPYNISSQILFKILEHKDIIPEAVGMFQKEVAERVAVKPNNKTYGIISVLLQAFYDIEYLFTVSENVFIPPPKVKSGVIRLKRNGVTNLGCSEKLFITIVKTAFNQRRKTLRNTLKQWVKGTDIDPDLLQRRPETLSPLEFIELTKMIEASQDK